MRGSEPGMLEWANEILDRQTRHMGRLVDELLDVSRISQGKIQLHKERLDLVPLVAQTVEDYRGSLENSRLRLELQLPREAIWIDGDPTRLAQVVGNLVQNACKFTNAGGQVDIEVRPEVETQRGWVLVRDTGIGIDESMMTRLFQSFAQADRSLDRTRGGLGLGLALVKGLVDLHGGGVQVSSAGLERGSEFAVWLPMAATPGPVLDKVSGIDRGAPALRILVVEDNIDTAETLRALLELSGHKVAVAGSGMDGVETARHWRPDVVLCDLGLPGLDGYAVARTLRQDPDTTSIRLIAVSGYGSKTDRQRCREAGFDLHLTKPVDPADLQEVLVNSGGSERTSRSSALGSGSFRAL
jgi:CheY-like chemotaxis protein